MCIDKKTIVVDENRSQYEGNVFQIPPDWRRWSTIPFLKSVINEPHKFQQVYDMLGDDRSKQVFDWLVEYSFLAQLLGDTILWETYEPSPLYRAFPGELSETKFKQQIEEAKKIIDTVPHQKDDFYTTWHTFIIKQYIMEGICEIKDDDTILDIGGYVGDTAAFFSKEATDGHIYTFEGGSWYCDRIRENLVKYDCVNVELITKFVADTPKSLYFKDNICYEEYIPGSEKFYATTIDEWASKNKITKIDFIKMDIEGGEYKALLGSKEVIKNFRPQLAISVYHNMYADLLKVPFLLKELCKNYKFYLSHKNIGLYETIMFCVPNQ